VTSELQNDEPPQSSSNRHATGSHSSMISLFLSTDQFG